MAISRNKLFLALAALVIALSSGCAANFKVVDPKVAEPVSKKALVVFLRPKRMENFTGGGAAPAKLYDGDSFVGELQTKQQLAYQANPGKHLFMVANGNADFLSAELAAGKTYYVVVEPLPNAASILLGSQNMGFTLRPQNGQIKPEEIQEWFKVMIQVTPNENGFKAAEKWDDKRKKLKEKYYAKWEQKPENDRPFLRASSGQ